MSITAEPRRIAPTTVRAPRSGGRNQRRLAPWLFLAPGVLMFAIYVISPIFESHAGSAFYDWDGLGAEDVARLGQLRRTVRRRGFLHLAQEQRHLAGPVPAGRTGGPVHRHFPQPDSHRHAALQVAVLLPVRDLAGRRRPDVLLVLRAQFRPVLHADRSDHRHRHRRAGGRPTTSPTASSPRGSGRRSPM